MYQSLTQQKNRVIVPLFLLLTFLSLISQNVEAASPQPTLLPSAIPQSPLPQPNGEIGWCTVAGMGKPTECYPDPLSACARQYDVYANHNNPFRGYIPGTTPFSRGCDWLTHIEGGEYTLLPTSVLFHCAHGYIPLPPGRCVRFPIEERDPCASKNGSPNPTDKTNPIIISTGVKYEEEQDYISPDGLFELSRHYRSFHNGVVSVYNGQPFGLGSNWRFDFSYELHIRDAGLAIVPAVSLYTPNGGAYDFSRRQNGIFAPTDWDAGQVPYSLSFEGVWPNAADADKILLAPSRWKLVTDDGTSIVLQSFPDLWNGQYKVARPLSITLRSGYQQNFSYASNGTLQSIVDSFNRRISFEWVTQERRIFNSNSRGLFPAAIGAVTLPDGIRIEYRYGSSRPVLPNGAAVSQIIERLISVHRFGSNGARLAEKHYLYEDVNFPFALTGIVDERGERVARWRYDGEGRAVSSAAADGQQEYTVQYVDTPSEAIRIVTNPFNRVTRYVFSRRINNGLRLTKVEGSDSGNPGSDIPTCLDTNRQWEYNSAGFVSATTDANGVKTTYSYDGNGRKTEIVEASGLSSERQTSFNWDTQTDQVSSITSEKLEDVFTYNSAQQLIELVQRDRLTGETRRWSYTYDSAGNQLSEDGPLPGDGDRISYEYDAQGNLRLIRDGLGFVTKVKEVTSSGLPARIIDPNGLEIKYYYHSSGNISQLEITDGSTVRRWQVSYNRDDSIRDMKLPDSRLLSFFYTANGFLSRLNNNGQESVILDYDADGNVAEERLEDTTGKLIAQQRYFYDSLSRLHSTYGNSDDHTWNYGYDREDQLITVTDPSGGVTKYSYDPHGRVIELRDAEDQPTQVSYNSSSGTESIKDPRNLKTTLKRNGWNEILYEKNPDRGERFFKRNALGQVIEVREERSVLRFRYDKTGRLEQRTMDGDKSATVSYHYDQTAGGNAGRGRLTDIFEEGGKTSYVYNKFGQIVRVDTTIGSNSFSTGYQYTSSGQLSAVIYPTGLTIRYLRKNDGSLDTITVQTGAQPATTVLSGYEQLPFGSAKKFTYGNGIEESREYDLDLRLAALKIGSVQQQLVDQRYLYADGKNITSADDQLNPGNSADYSYSPTDRLTESAGPWGVTAVEYDSGGNRKSVTDLSPENVSRYQQYFTAPNSNRLLSIQTYDSSRNFRYSRTGDLLVDEQPGVVKKYHYNKLGRLSAVELNGVTQGNYQYNSFDQLVTRQVNTNNATDASNGTFNYVYDLDGNLIAEIDTQRQMTREYLWIGQRLVATVDRQNGQSTPTLHFVHVDYLARPIAVTDQNQRIVWQGSYDPWGRILNPEHPGDPGLRFPGQWFHPESALFYNWMRHYDPSIGRYIQSDPIGIFGGTNTYQYAGGNPVMYNDPTGLYAIPGPHPPIHITLPGVRPVAPVIPIRPPAPVTTMIPGGLSPLLSRLGSVGTVVTFAQLYIEGIHLGGTYLGTKLYEHMQEQKQKKAKEKEKEDDKKGCPKDCAQIYRNILDAMYEKLERIEDMLLDRCQQFLYAREDKNPALPGACGKTTYRGHSQFITNINNRLDTLFKNARRSPACPIPPRAQEVRDMPTPTHPRYIWYPH